MTAEETKISQESLSGDEPQDIDFSKPLWLQSVVLQFASEILGKGVQARREFRAGPQGTPNVSEIILMPSGSVVIRLTRAAGGESNIFNLWSEAKLMFGTGERTQNKGGRPKKGNG